MHMIRTLVAFFGALLMLLPAHAIDFVPAPPVLSAKAYLLMDYDSGQILAAQNEDVRYPPASLTKMMTAYIVEAELAAGNLKLDDPVTVSTNAWAKNFPGSSVMFIEPGKPVTVEQLLRGIIIQSGNDASVAIAEHIAGSEDAFAQLMNAHAKRLGLTNTHFVNATGLPDDNHYSSARDLAILARAIIHDYPERYSLYKEKAFTYNGIRQLNRNALLWDKSLNVDGLKTGHTEKAGYCLVASAVKNNMRLISVVLGAPSENARKYDSKKLLNWGFRFYRTVHPVKANSPLHQVRVWYGNQAHVPAGVAEPVAVTLPRRSIKDLKAEYEVSTELEAPIRRGAVIGTLYFKLNGKTIKQVPLVALQDIEKGGVFSRLGDWFARKWK
ncbi:MAG: D-alanyl-D-alanine carboxypeptidase [Gammaproteobacteria bacterium]|nr:MAG: D-alanyl-D-alanine carboxypeptidase [Gammaproteobacteria bacterium]